MRTIAALVVGLGASFAFAQPFPPNGDFYWLDATFNANCFDQLPDDAALLAGLGTVASTGGTLVLPAGGVCIVAGALDITGGAHFVIEGNGATLLTADGAPVQVGVGALRYFSSSHFEIRNLTIDGNRDTRDLPDPDDQNPTVDNALVLRGVRNAVISNVRVVDAAGDGIYVAGHTVGTTTTRSQGIRLIGCTVERAARNGLGITNADDVLVLGGSFTATNGVLPRAGVDIEPGDFESVSNIRVVESTMTDNDGAGIQVSAFHGPVSDVRLSGNEISRNKRAALRLGGESLIVTNNQIQDHSSHPLNDDAVIHILGQNTTLRFSGNQITRIDADRDVLWARTGTASLVVENNTYSEIGFGNSIDSDFFAVIRSDVPAASIRGNHINHAKQRGIWSTGDRSVISDNTMTGMQKSVMLVRGTDVQLVNNQLGPLDLAGNGTSDEAVIRFRGSGGIVSGNAINCPSGTQTGYYFDLTPNVVLGNTIKACGPLLGTTKGFRYANGTISPGHAINIWY